MKIIVSTFAVALAATALVSTPALARHGADDPAGHVSGGGGKDDGPGHTFLIKDNGLKVARHGADDPAGDDRGGHGNDDGPNHT